MRRNLTHKQQQRARQPARPQRHQVAATKRPRVAPMRAGRSAPKMTSPYVKTIAGTQYAIELLMAILLLTGQIATTGLFIVPEGFAFSASGDVFGFPRLVGRSSALTVDLDFISVVSALLLIIGQVRVLGPYLAGSGLFIVYSGDIFGYGSVPSPRNPPSEKSTLLGQIMIEEMLHRLQD